MIIQETRRKKMNKLAITKNNGAASVVINNPPANILTIDLINEVNAFVLSLKDDRDTKIVIFIAKAGITNHFIWYN